MKMFRFLALTGLAVSWAAQAQMTPAQIQMQQQQHQQNMMLGAYMTDEMNRRRAAEANAAAAAEIARANHPDVCVSRPHLCNNPEYLHNRYGSLAVRALPDGAILWDVENNEKLFFFSGENVHGEPYDNRREYAVAHALQQCGAVPGRGECQTLYTFTNTSFVVIAGTLKSNQGVRFYFSFPTQAELAQQQGMGNTQAAKAFLQSREEAAQRAFARCQRDPAVMNCELWEQRDATPGIYSPGFEKNRVLEPQFR